MSQSLFMVLGGELVDTTGVEFINPEAIEIVGIYPDYGSAHDVWRGEAQRTVDNAQMRYFVLPLSDALVKLAI